MKTLISFSFIGLFLLANCKTLTPPQRLSEQSGAAVLGLELKPPVSLLGNKVPEVLYFIKADDPEKLLETKSIIHTAKSKDNRFYLFNASPGKYYPVAAFYKGPPGKTVGGSISSKTSTVSVSYTPGPSDYTTFFSEEIAKKAVIEVFKNKVVAYGALVVQMSLELSKASPFQQKISDMIRPGALEVKGTMGTTIDFVKGKYNYIGSLASWKNEKDTLAKMNASMKKDLQASEWQTLVVEKPVMAETDGAKPKK
ncbi:MAG: hypothetical protein AAF518_11915 [Spirochaetota bacterium]